MTSTRAINAAAGVIHACMQQGKTLPASQAYALEAAGLLNSPEHAAEVAQLHTELDGARLSLWEEEQDAQRARFAAKVARQRAAKLRVERDAWHDWADTLAYKVAPVEVLGRHGEDGKFPWSDALDLITPAAEVAALRARVAELEAAAGDGSTRTVDEDPIRYSLTPEALHASSGAVIEIPDRPRDGVYPQGTAHRQQMRDLIAGQRAALGNHDGPPHHDYRTGRDLPEVTP